MPLDPGTRIGPYEVIAPLGAGGMGEVYHARDTRLDRQVALKLLSKRLSHDAQAIGGFRREAVTLAALNHPNIATIHGIEETADGTAVLVMERVEGETLSVRLARGRMSVEESLQIGAQIAEALEVAHEHGIVHRDVKPGNVMIGARGLVKVLDFGLARRAGDRRTDEDVPVTAPAGEPSAAVEDAPTIAMWAEDSSLTGMVIGTPGYLSPEQALARAADARSDVFALGCVLYECLAGRRAFAGETIEQALEATVSSPADIAALPSALPARIRALIARSLEKEPDARPAAMRMVRVELEEALGIRRAAALREGTAYATPNNLPAQVTTFVGREGVLRECERLMHDHRLVTLLGMGGSGKTRIAQRIAEGALERFPDGVWFVDLSSVSDDRHVADVAAAVLGVQDEPGRSSLAALVQHVRDRRMLFVVDNCEHLLDGARGLVEAILSGCPVARVLATSREPLGLPAETSFPVPALELPRAGMPDVDALMQVESVRLFVERARSARSGFEMTAADRADVVEICRRLDGIPLALELAAARVRMLGIPQIRERLGDRFKLLARAGTAGPTRQQTLLATIRWSWDHLLPPEQDLMRRLAVFAGGWTLERATAVVSDSGDEFEVLDLLTRLVERSLVVVERPASGLPRYRFLESVHQFALEKLEASPDHAVIRDRHLDAYLRLAQSAQVAMTGAGLPRQVEELKPEEENILAAFEWCRHSANGASKGLRLAENVQRYWTTLGRFELGYRVVREALARDAGNPPNAERARALTRAAGFAVNSGDYDSAHADLLESLAFWRSQEDQSGLPAVLGGLGVVTMSQSRFEEAYRWGEECLALYEARGNKRGIAMSVHNLGTIEMVLGRPDQGRPRFEKALRLLREVGDVSTETLCLSALAQSCLRCGDRKAAHRFIRECFDLLAVVETPREAINAFEALAELVADGGDAIDAARLLGAARAARVAFNLPWMPFERADVDGLVARLGAAAGAEAVDRAIASGGTMTLPATVAEARRLLAADRRGVA